MDLRIIFYTFIIIISTTSCNIHEKIDNTVLTIDIEKGIDNMQQINLSQFTNNIFYVALENRHDISVGDHSSFDISDNLLLTTDRESNLLIFDLSGHLVKKFGKSGRGPEEYLNINNLSFGEDNKVYFNSMDDLFEFNPDGSLSGRYSKCLLVDNSFYLHQWCIVNDTLIFGHIQNDSGQIRYKAILVEKSGEVRHYYKNYELLQNRQSRIAGGSTQIFRFKGSLYLKEQFNDTLFSLNSDYELIPEYCFNLGILKMPSSVRVNFYEYFEKINDYIAIEGIYPTENYLFLKVNFGNRFSARRLHPRLNASPAPGVVSENTIREWTNTTFCLGIYDKRTCDLHFCKPTNTDNPLFTSGIYNDIDAGPRFFPEKQINDSTLVMAVSARELKYHVGSDDFRNNIPKYPEKKKQLEELANSLSEFDNPVFMLVRLNK